jgi:hypothetical protein
MVDNDPLFFNAIGPTFYFEGIDFWLRSLLVSCLILINLNKIKRLHNIIKG